MMTNQEKAANTISNSNDTISANKPLTTDSMASDSGIVVKGRWQFFLYISFGSIIAITTLLSLALIYSINAQNSGNSMRAQYDVFFLILISYIYLPVANLFIMIAYFIGLLMHKIVRYNKFILLFIIILQLLMSITLWNITRVNFIN